MDAKNKVMMLVNSGRVNEARAACKKACKASPNNAELWFILSAICGQQKDYASAEKYCKKVIKLNATVAAAHYNLAIAQRGLGKYKDAISSLNRALSLQNDFPGVYFELGNIYLETGNYEQAIANYEKLVKQSSDEYMGYCGLAKSYLAVGRNSDAIESYRRSLDIRPEQADTCNSLASIYDNADDADNAIKYYQDAIKHGYGQIDVYINLGRMFARIRDYSSAETSYRHALAINDKDTGALTGLALSYEQQLNAEMALDYITKVINILPDDAYTVYNYARILEIAREYTKAEENYRKAIDLQPDLVEAYINLGNICLLSGRADEACAVYKQAHLLDPQHGDVASNMLMSMNYTHTLSLDSVYESHLDWGRKIATAVDEYDLSLNAGDVIKIGYVSPDFRQHSVAYFFEAILRYTSKSRVSNYCYSDVQHKDHVTSRFESYEAYWRDVALLDDDELSSLIIEDEIDILVDLCGHVSGNRLSVFARKPAPVQISYLGYPNTTGLENIDYRLVDSFTDPEGSDLRMIEQPLYLSPGFLCYTPDSDSPDVGPLPALDNGFVTFGSFNNLAKITEDVVRVWSLIISQTPGSKLLLKARQFTDAAIKQRFISLFEKYGVSEDRLILLMFADSVSEHLSMYSKIDIALDTFPYNGTTTTFESLWMGVPVVTYSGNCHAARVGDSILNNSGYPELVAPDIDKYVEVACSLASDIEKLNTIRKNIRDKMEGSPLLDADDFVTNIEKLYQSIVKH